MTAADSPRTGECLVQMFLPLVDNDGQAYPRAMFDRVRRELTARFGGATAFLRAPAVGAWEDGQGEVHRDRVVLLEVMAERLDPEWWNRYRRELEVRFAQEELLVRAIAVRRL